VVWSGLLALIMVPGLMPAGAWAQEGTVVLEKMPADLALAAVLVNVEQLDKSVEQIQKRLAPDEPYESAAAGLKAFVPIVGEWMDLSKPLGIGLPEIPPKGVLPVMWVAVADFAAKVKDVPGATETEGVWQFKLSDTQSLFAKADGAYVVIAETAETLTKVTTAKESMAEALRGRPEMLHNRDVFVHVNMRGLRPLVLQQLSQMGPMLSMIAMMSAQSGGDPMMMSNLLGALLETVQKFIEQVAYVEAAVKLDTRMITLSIAGGFDEGPVKAYLGKQKPAEMPFFADLEEQPFFMAAASHLPGTESPLIDYVAELMTRKLASMPPATPAPEGGEAPGGSMKDAVAVMADVYRRIEGGNMVMAFTSGAMVGAGDYVTADPKALTAAIKQTLSTANPLMKQLKQGLTFEATEARKVGEVEVEVFNLKVDTSNPAGAMQAQMLGANPCYALGVVGNRVRYYQGDAAGAEKAFATPVSKPLRSATQVKEALEGLPPKGNAVVLVDPVGIMPMLGPLMMMGQMPDLSSLPPGPPIAASMSLAGDPAVLTVQVPVATLERLTKAFAGQPEPQ